MPTWTAVPKDAINGWLDHKAMRMSAALAYYTAFSIAPLVVIAVGLAGTVFGNQAARNQVFETLRNLMGADAAALVQQGVNSAAREGHSLAAAIIGGITLLIGATGVFGELHDGMNTIWSVEPKQNQGLKNFLRDRFLSFTMVLGTGFLLLVSLVITAVLAAMGRWLGGALPGGELVWQIVNLVISGVVTGGIFALLYRYVPDTRVGWRGAAVGAAVSTVLFSLGKLGLGLYIGKTGVASSYGAAGSLVVLLLWVYFSAMVLYFGAELGRALVARRNDTAGQIATAPALSHAH